MQYNLFQSPLGTNWLSKVASGYGTVLVVKNHVVTANFSSLPQGAIYLMLAIDIMSAKTPAAVTDAPAP